MERTSLYLKPAEMEALAALAVKFGYVTPRYSGPIPNVSGLIRDIALGKLVVCQPEPQPQESDSCV